MQAKWTGENYEKVKAQKVEPFKFATQNSSEGKKRNLLMYVDVNINPKKKGRIGIYENEPLTETAQNFCRTFQLNHSMQALLLQQLQDHLHAFYDRQQQDSTLEGYTDKQLTFAADDSKQAVLKFR